MKKLAQLLLATGLMTTACAASAQGLTEAQARAAIAPWYSLFNLPVQGDMKALQEQVLTADYESCWGYLPGECWGRDASIKVVGGFAKSIPDMKFERALTSTTPSIKKWPISETFRRLKTIYWITGGWAARLS